MKSSSIEWSAALEIGHPVIDRQHHKLFELAASMAHDSDQQRVMHTLSALREYVLGHFRAEEKLLKDIGYPELAAHKKLHDAFRVRLSKLYGNAKGMNLDAIAVEVRHLINGWLAEHIMGADREFMAYLKP